VAASLHGDTTPDFGRRVTLVPVTPYTTSMDVNQLAELAITGDRGTPGDAEALR
jgi:hypothetical protein